MTTALSIEYAGPYVSIQDGGRPGHLRFGVPRSGPMDRISFNILRQALTGANEFSAIEISVAGIKVRCEQGSLTAGLVGGKFDADMDGEPIQPWSLFKFGAGSTLTVRGGDEGSWAYLGFVGQIQAPTWLNSHSTHLYSGLCGRPFKAGDGVVITDAAVVEKLHGTLPIAQFSRYGGSVRAVLGPQDGLFSSTALEALRSCEFTITPNYNRMGMGLTGAALAIDKPLSMPSEALVRGAVQVMGTGDPFVLMADHQTTGGYPKIATVVSMDIDRLAQARPGNTLRFILVPPAEAVDIARKGNVLIRNYHDRLVSR